MISSAPMRELARGLTPPKSEPRSGGEQLKYRDFLTVMLILKDRDACSTTTGFTSTTRT